MSNTVTKNKTLLPVQKKILQNYMTIISASRIRLRSLRYLPSLLWLTLLTLWQAKRAPGNIHVQLFYDGHLTFWTLSAWENEATMRSYAITGAHRLTRPKLQKWCDEASIVQWKQETTELPNLKELQRRMAAEGKFADYLNHPSIANISKQITEPKVQ